jgi:Domain of unknown function (DUF4382)
MKRNLAFLCGIGLVALALASCSGLHSVTPPPPVGGTASLNLTIIDTPPANSSILSFELKISGITLNPASGTPVALTLNPSPYLVELTRLQSDSAFLGFFNAVPSGNYSSMTVTFASPVIVFANQTGSTVSGCANNSVCQITLAAPSPVTLSTTPFPLNLATNSQHGLSLDFNLNNAITFSAGTLGVDFTVANALAAATLPRGGTAGTNPLDLIEDFTGVVTTMNVSAQSVTVQSATRGTITALADSSTVFDDPFLRCTSTTMTFSNCVAQNQTVSIDVALNANGTFTLVEFEPFLNAPAIDYIEGVVSSKPVANATQFELVVSEKVQAASGSLITGLNIGAPVQITIGASPLFFVDPKALSQNTSVRSNAALLAFVSATDTSVIFPGQTIVVHPTSFTAANGATIAAATVNSVGLRWSRISGSINGTPTSPNFNIVGLPSYVPAGVPPNAGIPSLLTPTRVQTFLSSEPGPTVYDGVSDFSGLQDTNSVSIRALYLGPNPAGSASVFLAEKVRKH